MEEQEYDLPLIPNADRVFILRDESESMTPGGLYIPETDIEKANRGTVIATGPDCKFAFVGQKVVFGKHHGIEVIVEDQEITILRDSEIYGGTIRPTDKLTESEMKAIRGDL